MLDNRDISLMRLQQNDAMPDLVSIERRVLEDDGFGGYDETDRVIVAANVPARIVPLAMYEGLGQLARPVETNKYMVRMPIGTDVRDEDFLIREEDGSEMQVERVKQPRSWDTTVTAEAEILT